MAALTAIEDLQNLDPTILSDREARKANQLLFQLESMVYSARLTQVRELDARPSAVPGYRSGSAYRSLARHVLHQAESEAKADLEAARRLDPSLPPGAGGMPRLAGALAAGEISKGHVRQAVRATSKIPSKFLPVPAEDLGTDVDPEDAGKCGGDLIDELLTRASREHAPQGVARLGEGLLRTLAPDREDRFDERAHERRMLSFNKDSTGMVVGRFQLDEAAGAIFTAVMSVLSAPRPAVDAEAADGGAVPVRDGRSAGQRMADALGEICRRAASTILDPLDHPAPPSPAEPPGTGSRTTPDRKAPPSWSGPARSRRNVTPRILLLATPEQVRAASGGPPDPGPAEDLLSGPVSQTHLATTMCDAILQRVLLAPNGSALNLGRSQRLVSTGQRLALHARDKGCVIPGCTIPAAWTDAHHPTHWSDGGPTDIANLALVCPSHHHQIHAGSWKVVMRSGVPWVEPPTWVDPTQRLIRNTFFDAERHAAALGARLRAAIEEAS